MFRKLKMKRRKKQHDSLLESRLETISELTKGLGKPEFKLLMEAVEAVYEARTKRCKYRGGEMSRVLKFRAWDENNKQFADYEDIEECLSCQAMDGWRSSDGMGCCFGINTVEILADCIIEQYTGLKDKNGKEIYEGDIVKWLDGLGEYIVFRVEWQDNRARFCLRNEYSVFDYEDLSDKKKPYIEVIGNIHEPPKEFRPEHLKRMGVSISKGGEK